MDLFRQLRQLIKGEVKQDARTLDAFSKDASLFKIVPKVAVFPKDAADLKKLVKFADQSAARGEKISLTARSAGTDMGGGALTESVVVSMTQHFNRIKKVGRDFAIVQPGVFYRDFEKATLKKNLLLPSYPASRELCTVGGMVANNSGGELNLQYGKTEQYLNYVKMILRDGNEYLFAPLTMQELAQKQALAGLEGEIYRDLFQLIDKNYDALQKAKPQVSKNSAGYYLWNVYDRAAGIFDPTRLIVGSQGTLGLITEINFRLIRPKAREHLLVLFLHDLNQLPQITSRLLSFKPQSVESYDDQTFKVAMRLLPSILHRLKGNAVKLFFSFLPEMWMALTGGTPKLVVLAEFSAETDEEAYAQAQRVQEALREFPIKTKLIRRTSNEAKYWVVRRESFNLLRQHVQGMRTAPFIDDFVVRPEVLGEFLPKLYKILNKYHLLYTIAGHVGDGNFHIIPLMKLGSTDAEQIIRQLGAEVYDLVFQYHGSMTGEHNDGLVRSPYLRQMYGPKIYKLFEQTKKIFDPQGIFNPGKKTGASMDYAMSKLDFK